MRTKRGLSNPTLILMPLKKSEIELIKQEYGKLFYLSSKDGKKIHIGNPSISEHYPDIWNMENVKKYPMRAFRSVNSLKEDINMLDRPVYVIHMKKDKTIESYHIENKIKISLEDIVKLGFEEVIKL